MVDTADVLSSRIRLLKGAPGLSRSPGTARPKTLESAGASAPFQPAARESRGFVASAVCTIREDSIRLEHGEREQRARGRSWP